MFFQAAINAIEISAGEGRGLEGHRSLGSSRQSDQSLCLGRAELGGAGASQGCFSRKPSQCSATKGICQVGLLRSGTTGAALARVVEDELL